MISRELRYFGWKNQYKRMDKETRHYNTAEKLHLKLSVLQDQVRIPIPSTYSKHERKQNMIVIKAKYGEENRHSANPNLEQQKNEVLEKEAIFLDAPHRNEKLTKIAAQQLKECHSSSQKLRDSGLVKCSHHNNNINNHNKKKTTSMMNSSSTTSTKEHNKIQKLHKREKRHSLSPNVSRTFSRSRSSPTANEPIIEVDENAEILSPGPETPKSPLQRKGSILSPGFVFEQDGEKLVIIAGTEDKLLKTLADPSYRGKHQIIPEQLSDIILSNSKFCVHNSWEFTICLDDAYPRQLLITLHYWTTPHVVFDKLRELYVQTSFFLNAVLY
jgi:hypothetical protein